jgi:hypothetical protein
MRPIASIHSLSASAGKDSSTMALPAKKPSVSSGSDIFQDVKVDRSEQPASLLH